MAEFKIEKSACQPPKTIVCQKGADITGTVFNVMVLRETTYAEAVGRIRALMIEEELSPIGRAKQYKGRRLYDKREND